MTSVSKKHPADTSVIYSPKPDLKSVPADDTADPSGLQVLDLSSWSEKEQRKAVTGEDFSPNWQPGIFTEFLGKRWKLWTGFLETLDLDSLRHHSDRCRKLGFSPRHKKTKQTKTNRLKD